MTPLQHPDAGSTGGFFARAAGYGVPAPRPRLLLVVLMVITAAILVSTALDLAFLSAKMAYVTGNASRAVDGINQGTLRTGEYVGTLFNSMLMAGVLALVAFGYNWARWVWLIVCIVLGGLGAVFALLVTFQYSPGLGYAKCVLYLIFPVATGMLFAPSANAWFGLAKSLRKRPAAAPGVQAHEQQPYAPPQVHPQAPLVLPPRPRTLDLGLILCVVAAVAGSILSVLYMPELLAAQGLGGTMEWMMPFMYACMAVGAVLMVVMMYFIARGVAVVRWIWLAMAAFGALSSLGSLTTIFQMSLLYGICASGNQILMLAGTACMFLPASNQWMREAVLARKR